MGAGQVITVLHCLFSPCAYDSNEEKIKNVCQSDFRVMTVEKFKEEVGKRPKNVVDFNKNIAPHFHI